MNRALIISWCPHMCIDAMLLNMPFTLSRIISLPQALLTLNLLHGSHINPKLSAYAEIHGTFDHNRMPLTPPGICVMVCQKLSNRLSWGMHTINGWYIGPALELYHCYCIWIWETRMECICDTLNWFPTKVNLLTVSNTNLILAALQDIL